MRSSTSNSEAGRRKWLKAWLLAAFLVVVIVAAWETTLREANLVPAYADNRALWLSARHRLSQPDETAVAVLGASRIQRAIDVAVLSEQIDRPVVQLAVEGSSALPVLEDLAADPRFRGTVIFSIAPAFSYNRRLSQVGKGPQGEWTTAYRKQSRSRRMEQELRLFTQGLFAFRSADAAVSRIIPAILTARSVPGPDYKTTQRNRFTNVDLRKLEGNHSQEGIVELYRRNTEAYDQERFAEVVQYFGTIVDILKIKGCRVYVLRLPSGGSVLDYERREFPRDRFWNEMQRHIDAQFIHFEDHPELEGYLDMDGSHIANEKASEFTRQLASVLRAKGF